MRSITGLSGPGSGGPLRERRGTRGGWKGRTVLMTRSSTSPVWKKSEHHRVLKDGPEVAVLLRCEATVLWGRDGGKKPDGKVTKVGTRSAGRVRFLPHDPAGRSSGNLSL